MSRTMDTCPLCGAETIELRTEQVEVQYNSTKGVVESHYSYCDSCGCTQEGSADRRAYKRAVVAFKKQDVSDKEQAENSPTWFEKYGLVVLLGISVAINMYPRAAESK
ncbi:MAG: hypothetical protein RBR06_08595 [Desulfuromonadaceae bacterium]|nr:hypothetical protein [Desulfuromonadaceae bacterium]